MSAGTIRTLAIALATGDAKTALPLLSEDAEWEMVGRGGIVGRAAIATTLENSTAAGTVTLGRVLTDGNAGVVEGRIALSPTHIRRFCDLYELSDTDATVRHITSWDTRI